MPSSPFRAIATAFSPIHFTISSHILPLSRSVKMQATTASSEAGSSQPTGKQKIFVAGATGATGKRIVERLLAKGFEVKAGVRDVEKAKTAFPANNPSLQIVKADVTAGAAKLAEAIGDDSSAVICATGFRPGLDLFAPWKVDYSGTVNLVDACRTRSVNRFVLVSSILVNGAAMGQILNPAYIFLNVLGLTLVAKLQAEKYVRKSGINYTIVRPGGLRNEPPVGNLVMESEDKLSSGSVSRDTVADVAVEALGCSDSFFKVVEIVSRADAPSRTVDELFGSVENHGGNEKENYCGK